MGMVTVVRIALFILIAIHILKEGRSFSALKKAIFLPFFAEMKKVWQQSFLIQVQRM